MYECQCDERLKAKAEGSTLLTYTWLSGGLEHPGTEHIKIETRLIDERFESEIIESSVGECVIGKL